MRELAGTHVTKAKKNSKTAVFTLDIGGILLNYIE